MYKGNTVELCANPSTARSHGFPFFKAREAWKNTASTGKILILTEATIIQVRILYVELEFSLIGILVQIVNFRPVEEGAKRSLETKGPKDIVKNNIDTSESILYQIGSFHSRVRVVVLAIKAKQSSC
jgi:hypothetical protein